jgi:uncharacterized membrane protein
MDLADIAEGAGAGVDIAGVAVTVFGALIATGAFVRRLSRSGKEFSAAYRLYRQSLGRAILLGLEFLVAGDIIRTVAVSPTFGGVGVLAVIVLVRTFLSFSLEVEVDGRWPWQRRPPADTYEDQPA